jgi:histidyl-tRNA synthetase
VSVLRAALREVAPALCADCRRRAETNPLRVLDCKVPEDQPVIEKLPVILERLCAECVAHFEAVRRHLGARGIAFELRPRLVRGLDYYMRTTFEIVHGALGAQNSVLGGGRYDGLAEALGSKAPAPGIGFSIGEDRLVMAIEETHPGRHEPVLDVYVVPLGEAALGEAVRLARELRRRGAAVELSEERRLKRALEVANKAGARYALILGENELAAGRYALKDMATGEQESLTREELLKKLERG